MLRDPSPDLAATVDTIYRRDGRQVFATLVRLLGDLDRAEEALHDAFRAALERWPHEGIPQHPVGWLVSAGRFKAIDALRRARRFRHFDADAPETTVPDTTAPDPDCDQPLADDTLRLVFTCCHPSLPEEGRIALTLREVCGLTTEEIARAFLLPAPTLAQRIVRAKNKIRSAAIPFDVPTPAELGTRLPSVLRVIYLLCNEGYSASAGNQVSRHDLMAEAIRLAQLVCERTAEPECQGLLALLLLMEARRATRTDAAGDLVPLEEQDRSRWDRARIAEGGALVEKALASGRFGAYSLQAAIAALHAEAPTAAATDWPQIAGLYDALLRVEPTPVVALNRAVAIAMRDGPDAGLALIDPLITDPRLAEFHLAHAARADLHRRAGRAAEARVAYERALAFVRQEPERRFLLRRLAELPHTGG